MRKLKIADSETIEIAIQNEILRSEEARYDHRLHGILLACRGYSSYAIADMFRQNPTTVQRWIRAFEKQGLAGLQDCERSGRPASLTPKQFRKIDSALRKTPRELGYEQNLWDGKMLSYHIAHTYNVTLGARQCQRIFHKFGFRLRKPRPLIAHADPEKQTAFKKKPANDETKEH
jgi:transposase